MSMEEYNANVDQTVDFSQTGNGNNHSLLQNTPFMGGPSRFGLFY